MPVPFLGITEVVSSETVNLFGENVATPLASAMIPQDDTTSGLLPQIHSPS